MSRDMVRAGGRCAGLFLRGFIGHVPLDHMEKSSPYWEGVIEDLKERTRKWRGRNMSIFTRASACNIFLTAKLWYVLQVLYCARCNIQKM